MSLTVSLVLDGPAGPIELQDPAHGYELHKDTFATAATTHRKQEVSSEWMEGTFTSRGVRDNILEQVVVWVSGATQYEFQSRLQAIIDALEQLSFTMTKTLGNARWDWSCSMADYSVETSQEMLFATTGLIRAQVPRRPLAPMTQVVP